jgi:hypothetical protein
MASWQKCYEAEPAEPTAEELEALRALGYVG